MEGVGTVCVGSPLHVDVDLIDKQTRTLSVGTMHNSVRMPESAIPHAQRETPGPATSGNQRGWPTNGSPFIHYRAYVQDTLPCQYRFRGEHYTSLYGQMKKSAGYICPSRGEQFGNCDLRDLLAYVKLRATLYLPMGVHGS